MGSPVAYQTTGNKLSVWLIEERHSDIQRVITALAASRDRVSNMDYVTLDYEVLAGMQIKIQSVVGDTHDKDANERWHRDLTDLSATQVANLSNAIVAGGKRARANEKDVIEWIRQAVADGHIERGKLAANIISKIFPTARAGN